MTVMLTHGAVAAVLRVFHRWCIFFLALMFVSSFAHSQPAPPYVAVKLSRGVRVELPRNWMVFSENQRITLDAWVSAKHRSIQGEPGTSALGFAANYYDDKGKTAGIFNVRYYPQQTVTQAEARATTPDDVRELDAALQANIKPGVEGAGNSVLNWKGTKKTVINGLTFFVSEYRRTSPQNVPFRARLIRLFDGASSFTITVSYREDQHYVMSAITDHIIASIRK